MAITFIQRELTQKVAGISKGCTHEQMDIMDFPLHAQE